MAGSADHTLTLFARRRWRFCVALAIGLGLLQATPEVLDGEGFASIALRSLLWMFETPIQVLALSLAFDRVVALRRRTTSVVLASLFVAIAIGAILALGFVFVFQGLLDVHLDEKGPLEYPLIAVYGAIGGVLLAGIWGLAFVSPHLTEAAQRRQLETQELRFEADRLRVSSELARLRSQLEPHFLLNTLNTIAGLVAQRPREARRLLGCLGDLLRDALHSQDEMQTLEQEVTWLRRYAEILESRHGDALRFDWDIPPDVGGVLLPRLLLQPLVENAVQHGALCRTGDGRVAVAASLLEARTGRGRTLVCTVRDNGPGLSTNEPRIGALGLHTVRRRLELQCPGSTLRLQSSSDGTLAIVEVPLQLGGAA
jgi:signal transduction histidine kinase